MQAAQEHGLMGFGRGCVSKLGPKHSLATAQPFPCACRHQALLRSFSGLPWRQQACGFPQPPAFPGKAPQLGLEPCPRARDCPVSAHLVEMWNERLLIPKPCPKTFPSPPCPSPWLGQGKGKGRAQTRSSGRASLLPKQMFLCAAPGKSARGRRLSVNAQPPEKKEAQKKAASKKKSH